MSQTIDTLIKDGAKFGFCPGCGHHVILKKLDQVLVDMGCSREKTVLVTDIGCVGLSDQYFDMSAFHGLHGRSITYATGLKLARPELNVIVLMGDGGTGIGGTHLINAARRNVGITVLIFNNLNFGMTGGEHSVTTPHGGKTATTAAGNLEYPLDICRLAEVGHPAYVARTTVFDREFPAILRDAIQTEGFSLVDIWEFCTAYYVPRNKLNKKGVMDIMTQYQMELGVLYRNRDREELSVSHRQLIEASSQASHSMPSLDHKFEANISDRLELVIAGGAGQKVKSAAGSLGQAAIMCGLHATQKDDYPITIMTGHSNSELVLSPDEVFYTGITAPKVLVVVSPDGYRKAGRFIDMMDEDNLIISDPSIPIENTNAQVVYFDMIKTAKRIDRFAIGTLAIGVLLAHTKILPLESFREAIRLFRKGDIAEVSLRAIQAGEDLVTQHQA